MMPVMRRLFGVCGRSSGFFGRRKAGHVFYCAMNSVQPKNAAPDASFPVFRQSASFSPSDAVLPAYFLRGLHGSEKRGNSV